MLPKATVRGWQIDQLRKGLKSVEKWLAGVSPEDAATYRDGGVGWTALEVLGHLREYETIFFERARLTAETEGATLPNPDPDALAREGDYNGQSLAAVMADWAARREVFLAYLEGLDEAAWERTATHPRRGVMSLHDQLTLVGWHDANHIEQMTRIMAERR